MNAEDIGYAIGTLIAGIILFLIVLGIYALLFQFLWNNVMPLFDLPILGYWQAASLSLLLMIIFRGGGLSIKIRNGD